MKQLISNTLWCGLIGSKNAAVLLGLIWITLSTVTCGATTTLTSSTADSTVMTTGSEQELLRISKQKWTWMSERNVESLADLFHDKSVFVHMGATMNKERELGTIKGGGIQYKDVQIQDASVQIIGTTAILLNKIRLVAVVGGNEVTNPFMVTEVYVQENGAWKLGSLSFTKTLN